MERDYYVNLWLRLMLRHMKERKGFVNQSSKEGHISNRVFIDNVEHIADNIHLAKRLVRIILLWARDCVLMDNEELFRRRWAELGEYALLLMSEHGEAFCKEYEGAGLKHGGKRTVEG